jgi:hypothetical protein
MASLSEVALQINDGYTLINEEVPTWEESQMEILFEVAPQINAGCRGGEHDRCLGRLKLGPINSRVSGEG